MKKVIFMLAAAALVVSCTKTEVIDMNADGVLIQAKPVHQLVDGSVTRAPFDGNITASNILETQVLTFKNSALSTVYANGLMSFASTTNPVAYADGTANDKFAAQNAELYTMYGLYPKNWTVSTPTAPTFTFDGNDDVMITAAATTSADAVKGGSYPSLTFKHQLTKLVVKVQAMDAAAATTWGNLEAITLTELMGSAANVTNTATYTLATENMAFTGGGSPMSFWVINSSQVFTETAFASQATAIQEPNADASNIVPVAYCMVAPFTPANSKDITLSVKAVGKTAVPVYLNVKALSPGVNTAGYAYTITLTFTDTLDIVATADVVAWIDGEDIGGVVIQ